MHPAPPAIAVRGLNVWYGSFPALKHVDLEIPAHRITALIGASGSGKSSFLRSLNRMLDTVSGVRSEGEVVIDGRNALDHATDVIQLRRDVGMVFQNPTPFPKSVYRNVSYGLEIQGMASPRRDSLLPFLRGGGFRGVADSAHPVDHAVVRSLKEASLWEEVKDRLHISAYRLSGGQQQRLCIARAIAVRPKILLLDEPCASLDPISTHHIEDLLLSLKANYTIVIVTHNMQQARRVSDFTGFFHEGKLIEFGPTPAIFENAGQALTRQYVRGEFG